MVVNEDSSIPDLAAEAYERWRARWADAALAIESARDDDGVLPYEQIAELKERYPDAVAEYIGLTLHSPEVIRKLRRTSPGWLPPSQG